MKKLEGVREICDEDEDFSVFFLNIRGDRELCSLSEKVFLFFCL